MDESRVKFIFEMFLGETGAKKLADWMQQQGRDAFKYLFATDLIGRKRYFSLPDADDPEREEVLAQIKRWAMNSPFQGSSASMTKLAMVYIYEAILEKGYSWEDMRIILTVHDELLMTCKEELQQEGHDTLKSSMTRAYDELIQGIVNEVEVNIGKNWVKK